jgi:hypothetical protein
MFTHELRTEIDIAAAPEIVWAHLVDVGSYPDWNPFITSLKGSVQLGARLSVRMQPPDGRPMTFRPRVTELIDGRVLAWLGHLGVPGLFDGRHRFELTPMGSSTHLVQGETFRGLLVPLLRKRLDGSTRRGFVAMNTALARRAEATAQSLS